MTRAADAPLLTSWLIALGSTLTVLFIGKVLWQAPCIPCWYQRAFMFPLVLLLGVGFWRGDTAVRRYSLSSARSAFSMRRYRPPCRARSTLGRATRLCRRLSSLR